MPRSWVTFKDVYGSILVENMEMASHPRQGETVYVGDSVYKVYDVRWTILPEVHSYRTIVIFLELVASV